MWIVTLRNRSSRPVGTIYIRRHASTERPNGGKIRLALTPWTNHSWHVTFYVTSRGLTTSPIPHGVRTFEINFDFIDHQVRIDTSDGERRTIELKPRSVADFYRTVMKTLD